MRACMETATRIPPLDLFFTAFLLNPRGSLRRQYLKSYLQSIIFIFSAITRVWGVGGRESEIDPPQQHNERSDSLGESQRNRQQSRELSPDDICTGLGSFRFPCTKVDATPCKYPLLSTEVFSLLLESKSATAPAADYGRLPRSWDLNNNEDFVVCADAQKEK
ncbi:hypothetical protein CEXT_284111 [Caerostris extrusa]|uniref:Uncharacterized protein n=1 Tax=Caerostris extrusa TaxID=172846 RepID=A0AAV4NZP6_CAEEX|nr:hypothetical protein CEXT_284111 [Caerostris extrusa]